MIVMNTTDNGTVCGGVGHSHCSSARPQKTGTSSVAETSRGRMAPERDQNKNPDILSLPELRNLSDSHDDIPEKTKPDINPDIRESEFELGPASSDSPSNSIESRMEIEKGETSQK